MSAGPFDYELPPERIAQHPTERREDARLLVVERAAATLHDRRFSRLEEWLRPPDVLVVNETRVRNARLALRRPSGGRVEALFVRESSPGHWHALLRPAKKAPVGSTLASEDESLRFEVVEAGAEGARTLRVLDGDVESHLRVHGDVPLPPYVRRAPEPEDRDRYQTVFARTEGAVAAPTAGLHFSEGQLATLAARGIGVERILLHVGPGTFRPVTESDPRRHTMDEEWFEVSESTAAALRTAREEGGRIVAVGTTSVRALESACDANGGRIAAARGWTKKYILPPYRFQAVDALITNFHLPRTTLLLLVAAFAGEDLLRRAYHHAIEQEYRFYSYGDAMLIV